MKLEEVKAKCTGVSIATINLDNEYSLTEEVKWLIKQAEKVERLERENRKLNREIGDYSGKIGSIAEKLLLLEIEMLNAKI
jgi:predicted RNase H-like nuclease (RuvC/YqgF family)